MVLASAVLSHVHSSVSSEEQLFLEEEELLEFISSPARCGRGVWEAAQVRRLAPFRDGQRCEVIQYDEGVMTVSLASIITYVNRFSGF